MGENHACYIWPIVSLWDELFASQRTLEEQDMGGWIGEHLAYGGSLSCVGVTKEEIL